MTAGHVKILMLTKGVVVLKVLLHIVWSKESILSFKAYLTPEDNSGNRQLIPPLEDCEVNDCIQTARFSTSYAHVFDWQIQHFHVSLHREKSWTRTNFSARHSKLFSTAFCWTGNKKRCVSQNNMLLSVWTLFYWDCPKKGHSSKWKVQLPLWHTVVWCTVQFLRTLTSNTPTSDLL